MAGYYPSFEQIREEFTQLIQDMSDASESGGLTGDKLDFLLNYLQANMDDIVSMWLDKIVYNCDVIQGI